MTFDDKVAAARAKAESAAAAHPQDYESEISYVMYAVRDLAEALTTVCDLLAGLGRDQRA